MNDDTDRCSYRETYGVGNGMVHTDKFHLKNAEIYLFARIDAVELRNKIKRMLLQLAFKYAERERVA